MNSGQWVETNHPLINQCSIVHLFTLQSSFQVTQFFVSKFCALKKNYLRLSILFFAMSRYNIILIFSWPHWLREQNNFFTHYSLMCPYHLDRSWQSTYNYSHSHIGMKMKKKRKRTEIKKKIDWLFNWIY